MTHRTALAATLLGGSLILLPAIALAQSSPGGGSNPSGSGTIVHTAVVGSYSQWLGQSRALSDQRWGYGATIRYLAGGMPLGLGVNWMRNDFDTSGTYRADGKDFRGELSMDRLGGDLYYRLPPNARGNVPYLLAGGGQTLVEGDLASGERGEAEGAFWEAGLGIVNGGSNYTAFALELKYVGTLDDKVRRDDGIIELSMSIGYNW